MWIDDPGGYFPLDKRPVRDAREHYFEPCALDPSLGAQRVAIGKDGTIRIVPLPLKQDSEEKPPVAIEEEAEAVF